MVAYYSFDSDFTDASANNNHLTASSGSPYITNTSGDVAFGGGALNLDQSGTHEHLSFASAIDFDGTSDWSIAWWGKRSTSAGGPSGMVAGTITNSSNFIWTPDNSSVVQGLRLRNNSGASTDYGGFPDDNTYHHWAVSFNSSTNQVTVWRDNNNIGTKSFSGNISLTHVGAGTTNQANSFFGQIDEFYIYDEAIDAATVSNLYAVGDVTSSPDETPPTLASSDIVATTSTGTAEPGEEVIYTVTFSEDMDAATVDSSDFGNAGTAPVTFGSIVETSPGVFSVTITPSDTGTLQLVVLQGATLSDTAGNNLDTTSAIDAETELTVETAPPPTPVTRIHVFLLGGQSNADGRADPSGLPTSPVNLQLAQQDVDLFEGGSLSTLAPGSQFGPEITMGRRLADSFATVSGTRIAIIKYAVGGTSLASDWKAGGDDTTTGDGGSYVTFQNTVNSGMAALSTAYPDAFIEIKGMLWVQGERDAKTGNENTYQSNLITFIDDVRATFKDDLPFIISRLSIKQTNISPTPLATIRTAQTNVAASDDFSRLIDTDTFGIQSDNLHFDALGQQDIGDSAAFQLLDFFPFTKKPTLSFKPDGDLEISVQHPFPDFIYTLKSNPDLSPESWATNSSTTAATATLLFTITPGSGQQRGFYQIIRTMPGN